MQYGQIVFLLFIALLFYYAALIVLDILKAKAAQAVELESQSEEDIDSETKSDREQPESNSEQPFHRPGFREAIMTDGILVEDLVVEVNKMVENGICDLGSLIADCENAK